MKFNVGTPDRIARIIVGGALVLLAFFSGLPVFASPAWLWTSVIVGAVLVVTALVRFCPLYGIFGVSTCKAPRR